MTIGSVQGSADVSPSWEPRSRSKASSWATSRPAGSAATTCRTRVTGRRDVRRHLRLCPGGAAVAVGDEVHVVGDVSEFSGLTEITADGIAVCASGVALPAPAVVSIPPNPPTLESLEGMRVTLPQASRSSRSSSSRVTAPSTSAPSASITPTAVVDARLARTDRAGRGRTPRTASRSTTAVPRRTPTRRSTPTASVFTLDNSFRGGDLLTNVTGVLDSPRERPRRLGPLARAAHRGCRLHGREPPQRDPRARGRRHDQGVELQRAELLHDPRLARRERSSRSSTGRRRRSSRRSPRSTPTSSASSRSRTTATPRSARSSTRSTSASEQARTTSSPRESWAPT